MENFKQVLFLVLIIMSFNSCKDSNNTSIDNPVIPKEFTLVSKGHYTPNGGIYSDRDSVYKYKSTNKEIDLIKQYFPEQRNSDVPIPDDNKAYHNALKRRIAILLSENDKRNIMSSHSVKDGFYIWYSFNNNYEEYRHVDKFFIEKVSPQNRLITLKYIGVNLTKEDIQKDVKYFCNQFDFDPPLALVQCH